MDIRLARIDDRLIHGQVATVWTKETKVERIIVCNDDVAKDEIRSTLLKQVAPPGVKSSVVDVEKAIRVYNNPKYETTPAMLLFTNPTDVLRMVEAGVPIKTVNIGGMAYREGRTQITNAVSVGPEDITAFRALNDKGIELEIRKVAADSKVMMIPLLDKESL
ncbi:mannose/fructose/sorbose PTS transporter subunit IIB [Listeria riparia]|uniref:PTS system mannose-specific transporter subunit IIAB n=1 Tax=Listeria riparia FSL S10-1204 TaxID=1265816 RepID=W7DNT4_9LIST|nr:mannose/fructose/sorbose PTS transporter subunit IIB [Listeria riparia]EUJ46968.1 PTS system mannose-specific transporter subunit IIAB [Listeria riparia FSL S10-1204]